MIYAPGVSAAPWMEPFSLGLGLGSSGANGADPNLYFFLIVGQSNGTGNGGFVVPFTGAAANSQALTTSATTYGKMLQTGVIPGNVRNAAPSYPQASLAPLAGVYEGLDLTDYTIHGESMGTALCRYLQGLTGKNYGVACVGSDGWSVSQISQGTTPYNWMKLAAQEFNGLWVGGKAICLGLIYVGGEQDAVLGSTTTTVAAGSNGVTFPLSSATLNTAVFTNNNSPGSGFAAGAGSIIIQSTAGPQFCTYATSSGAGGTFSTVSGGNSTGATGISGAQMLTGMNVYRADYYSLMLTLQANAQTDIATITGQNTTTYPIPIYITQQFAYPPGTSGVQTGKTTFQDYLLHVNNVGASPPKFIHTYPRYAVPGLSPVSPGLHLNNGAQRYQGEMVGKAIWNVNYSAGKKWDSLRITGISRTTNVITVTLNQPPQGTGFFYSARKVKYANGSGQVWGISYYDSGATITVSSVAWVSGTSFTITLSADPTANTFKFIRIAWVAIEATNNNSGKYSGARANLFGATTASSNYGYDLSDPIMCLEEAVP